jgi:hypothetical protein
VPFSHGNRFKAVNFSLNVTAGVKFSIAGREANEEETNFHRSGVPSLPVELVISGLCGLPLLYSLILLF